MSRPRILIVDGQSPAQNWVHLFELIPQFEPILVGDAQRALRRLDNEALAALVLDIDGPELDGLGLLERVKRQFAQLPVVLVTEQPQIETAIAGLQLGAADYLMRPLAPAALRSSLQRVLMCRKPRVAASSALASGLVGDSDLMRGVHKTIDRVAPTDVDVLLVGETGTGKELVARSIHEQSRRRQGPFVPVDCAVIPEHLMASELFGHERGAFTGAGARSLGLLELADGGTVFLDEVLSLSLPMQAKLLRALQERRIRRVGGKEELPVDIRVIAAANRCPADEVRAGRFREDLFYRINVGTISLPPLRERGGDVRILLHHYLQRFAPEMGRRVRSLSDDATAALMRHRWPGNVRELQNVVRQALLACDGEQIELMDLPSDLRGEGAASPRATSAGASQDGFFDLRQQRIAAFERAYLIDLLRSHRGEVVRCAEAAAMPRATLYRLLKKHDIDPSTYRLSNG